mgnify:CR=1 FL=1
MSNNSSEKAGNIDQLLMFSDSHTLETLMVLKMGPIMHSNVVTRHQWLSLSSSNNHAEVGGDTYHGLDLVIGI